jgi:acyl transferase domain-containing protein/3-hydroxymyristoyl/3-hydroxydecanoyl-(acyl carrier protein) dehydratase
MEPIAVLGRGCVLPGALTPDALWQAVAAGRNLTSDPPEGRWGVPVADLLAHPGDASLADKTWGARGGYVRGFEGVWNPSGFQVSAADLAGLDPVCLWLLHAARAAWSEAGQGIPASRTGVVVGNLSYPTRGLADFAASVWRGEDASTLTPLNRFSSGYPAHLAAKALGLGGPAFALDAACASSLYALKIACDLLADRTVDVMVVGAVNACDNLFLHVGFTALGALSKSGASRPFSRRADGLLPAEGAAAVVLMRAADVDPTKHSVYGLIRGVGVSNDGKRRGLLAPDGDGQREAIARAYAAAGVDPATVSLMECHATGTPGGDPIEVEGLAKIFAGRDDLPIGSLKSNTGHLITAAGLGGLLKLLGALAHETAPATLHADDPIPAFANGPARPLTKAEAWPAGDEPRRAGLSAFGFGGNNAHLVLEEYRLAPRPTRRAAAKAPPDDDIVICSVGATAGGARGLAAVLARLEAPPPAKPAARIEEITVDLAAVRVPPADLKKTLAQQTLMFDVADEALAGVVRPSPERAGVIVGMGCDAEAARWALRWRTAKTPAEKDSVVGALEAAHVLGAMPNVPANRLNVLHDLRGLGFTVSSEELSGVDALRVAAGLLRRGELDLAIVGAVDLADEPVHTAAVRVLIDSSTVPGDAAVALVLKRRADAERDGDPILATLTEDAAESAKEAHTALAVRFGAAHAASGLLALAVAAAAGARGRRLDRDGAKAWLQPSALTIEAQSFSGRTAAATLAFDQPLRPSRLGREAPRLIRYAAQDMAGLAARLRADIQGGGGPCRLALVAVDPVRLEALRARAAEDLSAGKAPAGPGVCFAARPVDGELALVFTGAAAAYSGMGRELLAAFPDMAARVRARFEEAQDTADRLARGSKMLAEPFEQLRATTLVSQLHAEIALDFLKLEARAALGLSSGETNALLAFGAWHDPDELLADVRASSMYGRALTGRCESAAEAWGLAPGSTADWRSWRALAPLAGVQKALEGLPRVTVAIVHGPSDCVFSGDAESCQAAIARLGAGRCAPLGQDMVVHCAEAQPFADEWRRIHSRETAPVEGVRFYANATNAAYIPTRETAADMLTRQAVAPVDFPRTLERAWAEGVRVFVEMGPRDALTRSIAEALKGRPHLAVAFDRFGAGEVQQIAEAAAALWAAGVALDIEALEARLAALAVAACPAAKQPLRLPAHPPAVPKLSRAPAELAGASENASPSAKVIVLPRPPRLAKTEAVAPRPRLAASGGVAVLAPPPRLAPVTAHFSPPRAPALPDPAPPSSPQPPAPARPQAAPTRPARPASPAPERTPQGPAFDRAALEAASRGPVSALFGPAFARQDGYSRVVRMPAPPLLLADRVTGIEGAPGVQGKGTIWTETDVGGRADHLLHIGRMRPGIVIESGQADLLLASWMGVDFLNKSERVYRLLGCELTFHEGGLPRDGETLRFQINIDTHATAGDVRLFFFNYDARVDGRPLLSVRNGLAGFFADTELAQSQGVLWDAETSPPPTASPRLAPLPRASKRGSFSAEALDAFHAGDAHACFGEGFERASAHQRSPKPPSGRLRMIDAVEAFEPQGGPWKRGYLRATAAAPKDAWFYDGHFHNDPCMPGTLMAEAAVQAVELFMVAAGLTVERDGWRFEPMPGEAFTFVCRGQVIPDGDHRLTYEVFVDEIVDGPEPVLYAALLARSDGFKVFQCPRFGVRLKKDWPIFDRPEKALLTEPPHFAHPAGDVRGDIGALTACAWGPPSAAFGSMYARFDRESGVPRLPGPPYHVVSRIVSASHPPGAPAKDITVVAEYDPPPDAWYFKANGAAVMPFSVLTEVLLQPCGWLASYCGFALEGGLAFRNLDGEKAIVSREARPGDGPLRVTTRLTKWSKAGPLTIVFFDMVCVCGSDEVMRLATSFGFFPRAALAAQAGLPTDDALRARLTEPLRGAAVRPPLPGGEGVSTRSVDKGVGRHDVSNVAERPADPRLFDLGPTPPAPSPPGRGGTSSPSSEARQSGASLPKPPLSMIDAVAAFDPAGGEAGLGRIRGRQAVDPNAWYFKAHFYEDPVQPGSLGLEALLQLLEHALKLKGLDAEFAHPRFEAPALGGSMTWKYRGQVTPEAKEVLTTLDILTLERDKRGLLATAKASLWADGLRIYEATGLTVRIVESDGPRERRTMLSLGKQPWLADHRPTYVLPALPMMGAVQLAAEPLLQGEASALPLLIEDFALTRWIVVGEDAEVAFTSSARPREGRRFELTLTVDGAQAGGGKATLDADTPPEDVWPEPTNAEFVADLYESGSLFHGPAFHLLADLVRGQDDARATLDATKAFDPKAELDIGLLDALLHAIPHDAPESWFGPGAQGFAAYPNLVERLIVHRPRPKTGALTVRARPLPGDPAKPRLVRVAIRAEDADGVWLEMTLREILMPKGPLGALPPGPRRAFLAEGAYVRGAGLSRLDEGATVLTLADVGGSDWLPGTLKAVYDLRGAPADVPREIAIKEHAARAWRIHPRGVTVGENEARAGGRSMRVTAAFDPKTQSWRIETASP